MTTTVTPSKTVVPLPATIIGAEQDESGNIIVDEAGNPVIAQWRDQILDAIYALAQEFRTANSTTQAELKSIQTILTSTATST